MPVYSDTEEERKPLVLPFRFGLILPYLLFTIHVMSLMLYSSGSFALVTWRHWVHKNIVCKISKIHPWWYRDKYSTLLVLRRYKSELMDHKISQLALILAIMIGFVVPFFPFLRAGTISTMTSLNNQQWSLVKRMQGQIYSGNGLTENKG